MKRQQMIERINQTKQDNQSAFVADIQLTGLGNRRPIQCSGRLLEIALFPKTDTTRTIFSEGLPDKYVRER